MVSEQHTGSYVMQPGKSLGKTQEIAKLLKPVPQWTNITIRDLLIYIYIYGRNHLFANFYNMVAFQHISPVER